MPGRERRDRSGVKANNGSAIIVRQALEVLARLGYGARGVVYIIAAFIALGSVLSGFASETSPSGALSFVKKIAFGEILLLGLVIGLAGHSIWRLAQAIFDADDRGTDLKGIATRTSMMGSAVTHASLALLAMRMALGMQSSDGGSSTSESLVRTIMSQSFGDWLVGGIAAIILVVAISQIYRGIAMSYLKWIDLPDAHEYKLRLVCSYGLAARGALFIVVAGFFFYAALTVDPEEAGTMAEALDWVRQLPFGFAIYTLAALGLLAFGAYSVIEAIYRHVEPPRSLSSGLGRHVT